MRPYNHSSDQMISLKEEKMKMKVKMKVKMKMKMKMKMGQSHHVLLFLILIQVFFLLMAGAEELSFEHAVFDSSTIADIVLVKESEWYQGQGVSFTGSAIWLTPDPTKADSRVNGSTGNLGRIVYRNPFILAPAASFATSFTFQLIMNSSKSGSGMAFFMSTSSIAPNNRDGGALGLIGYADDYSADHFPPHAPFFAVEFDTSESPLYKDPSQSHVGIDINSIVSSNVTDTNDTSNPLYLYHNYTFTAWIEYESSSRLIQVWMTNVSSHKYPTPARPLHPILSYTYDISTLFNGSVYAGFSSTNRFGLGNLEGCAIYAWNFSMTDPTSTHPFSLGVLIGVPSALVVLLILAAGFAAYCCWIRHSRNSKLSSRQPLFSSTRLLTLSGSRALPQRYRHRDLKRAAGGFSEAHKIGEGGYSSVYLAKLPDGSLFALKKLKDGVKKEQDFVSEIEIISTLRHRNLLALEGWCYEKGEALLLYKYMSKGSLDQYIYEKKKESEGLGGDVRLKILAGIAAGLEYLHTGLGSCILHRDVKAENVLLTDELEPVLCDFGLARLISHNQEVTLTAVGTPGYVAPELVYTGRGTDKADVYSFGVLSLVVACGRRPIDPFLPPQEGRIIDWVWLLHKSDKLEDALDPSIVRTDEWIRVLHLALTCCHPNPDVRPTMRQVIQVLKDKILLDLPATMPAFPMMMTPDWSRQSEEITTMSQSQLSSHPFFSDTSYSRSIDASYCN